MNRRSFLTIATLGIGALAVSNTGFAEERKRGGSGAKTAELVDENSAQAKALNYKSDKNKISDSKLKTERQGIAFEKQVGQKYSWANSGTGSFPSL